MSKIVIEGNRFWDISRLCMRIQGDGKLEVTEEELEAMKLKDIPTVYVASNQSDIGFVAEMEDGIVVAFKGTDNFNDFITDINITLTDLKPYGPVHSGFYNAVSEIGPKMIKQIEIMLKELPPEKQMLYIVGHSKGGAMATVFSCQVKQITDNLRVITYGSPRVASKTFAQNYNLENYAYVSFLDIVPHLPITGKERELIKRQSPVYSASAPILNLMDFFPIGKRIDIYVERNSNGEYNRFPYIHLPKQQNNASGETLNSWCAIEWLLRDLKTELINEIHNGDYETITTTVIE